MKPNFEAMNREELRTYILQYREEDEAFHTYMNRLNQASNGTWFPAPNSIDDLSHCPELLKQHSKEQ